MIKAIVTDIEGTTSSISFVKEVLFPYASEHLPAYVRKHRKEREVREQLNATAELSGIASHDTEALIRQLLDWIATDTKAIPLKSLQGMIWQQGYETGVYQAHVYADAEQKLSAWHAAKLDLYVYSSGSVRAQQLFFHYSLYGDMRPLFRGYFDTTTGAKHDERSYRAITAEVGRPAKEILFLSDIELELDAAAAAGLHTCWLLRPEELAVSPEEVQPSHPVAKSFADIQLPTR